MTTASRRTNGFTMIELMLAMAFISVLLLAIAMTTIQVSNIYTKGITLREVNQAGRSVTGQLRNSINQAVPFDVADNTVYVKRDFGGRLCLGQYSYIWNYGETLADTNPSGKNVYAGSNKLVRFAKVYDRGHQMCPASGSLPAVPHAQASELLSGGDRDLAVQGFTITGQLDPLSGQGLYTIQLTIGTNDQGQLTTNDASCKPPTEGEGNENYCSVNQFTIVARAGNQAGGSN